LAVNAVATVGNALWGLTLLRLGSRARSPALVAEHAEGALEAHALRTRRAGPLTFIEFHLVVPGDLAVKAAHQICDRLEEALRTEIKGCRVMIHVEPEGKAKHRGILVL
jgi:divalent metal cation (Fe/Co/Zn/Cd) transporter